MSLNELFERWMLKRTKELQELTYEIDKEINEALGKPNLQ